MPSASTFEKGVIPVNAATPFATLNRRKEIA